MCPVSDVRLWRGSRSHDRDREPCRGHRSWSNHRTSVYSLFSVLSRRWDANQTPSPILSHIRTTALQHVQIVQARNLASRRGARYLSAEDLIFLIRHDRAKVNRLRTYLSWKDVRRHAKDSGGDGAAGMEVETLEDGADGEPSPLLLAFSFG